MALLLSSIRRPQKFSTSPITQVKIGHDETKFSQCGDSHPTNRRVLDDRFTSFIDVDCQFRHAVGNMSVDGRAACLIFFQFRLYRPVMPPRLKSNVETPVGQPSNGDSQTIYFEEKKNQKLLSKKTRIERKSFTR